PTASPHDPLGGHPPAAAVAGAASKSGRIASTSRSVRTLYAPIPTSVSIRPKTTSMRAIPAPGPTPTRKPNVPARLPPAAMAGPLDVATFPSRGARGGFCPGHVFLLTLAILSFFYVKV